MRKTALVLAIALLANIFAFGQGGEAMRFSAIVRDPAKAAMGFAGKAYLSSTAWASFSNPAAVAASENKFDAGAAYGIFAPKGTKHSGVVAGVSYKPKKLGVTAGFLNQKGASYDVIEDNSGNSTGSFSPSQMQLNFGLAYSISKKISAGAAVKYMSEKIAKDATYNAVWADLFAMYVSGPLRAAAGLSNLGGKVEGANGTAYKLPSALSLGAGYCSSFAEAHTVNALLDVDWFFTGAITAALGAEYSYNDLAFVRAGYHFGCSKAIVPSFFSLGLGVKFKDARLDAAYLLGNENLSGTFSVGLGYSF